MAKTKIHLGNRMVGGDEPVYIICEAGVTNYGEVDLAKRQIDAACAARADIIKFQISKTEAFVSRKVAKRVEKELGYNWFSRMKYKEFEPDETREIARYAATCGFPFFATIHDEESFEFFDNEFDPPFFKIGSGEAHNYEFLKLVGSRKKPVIISFGLQSDQEIMKAIEILTKAGACGIAVLHCTTLYPTPYHMVDLSRIRHLESLTGLPVGLSDHSVGWHAVLAGTALGARIIEKHLTFDKDDSRSLDNAGALLPHEFKQMVKETRDIEKMLKVVPEDERLSYLAAGRDWAGQSIIARFSIRSGTLVSRDMITFKRPARGGLPPSDIDRVLGRRVKVDIEQDEQVLFDHLE